MRLDTILFDLDGTLLPMQQDAFIDTYFGLLAKRVTGLGYEPKPFLSALWNGTSAMMHNDGAMTNRERFWQTFTQEIGPGAAELEDNLAVFYATDFNATAAILKPRPPVRPLLTALRAKGYGITLATNPLFPLVAAVSRLGWIGLTPADFDYVTTYENSRYCKPNLGYYRDLLAHIEKEPGQCLMVGNSPQDDMAAAKLGMPVFLLTDNLENARSLAYGDYPQGGFGALAEMLEGLPALGAIRPQTPDLLL